MTTELATTDLIRDFAVSGSSDRVDVDVHGETRAPDLMEMVREAEAAAGFLAVFDWVRGQEFDPDHAERVRREAWGDLPE